jgi:hypothetical protein
LLAVAEPVQVGAELGGRLVAVVGQLGHCLQADGLQRRRHVGVELPRRGGVLLPDRNQLGSCYATEDIELVRATLQAYGFGDLRPLPLGLTREGAALIQGLDWVVTDIGEPVMASLAAYLHGRFVPTMRLLRRTHSPLEDALYGVVEVGYRQVTGELASSAIGIALLAPAYVASGNCLQELQQMVAYRNDKKMRVIPVKLESQVELPHYVKDIQYLRWWEYGHDPTPVVEAAPRGVAERDGSSSAVTSSV